MPSGRGGARPGAGRPAGSKNIDASHVRELAQAHTAEMVTELARLAKEAKSETARVSAINSLLDRAWGKVTQPIGLDEGDQPLTITVRIGGEDAGDRVEQSYQAAGD